MLVAFSLKLRRAKSIIPALTEGSFFRASLIICRYTDNTSFCKPEYLTVRFAAFVAALAIHSINHQCVFLCVRRVPFSYSYLSASIAFLPALHHHVVCVVLVLSSRSLVPPILFFYSLIIYLLFNYYYFIIRLGDDSTNYFILYHYLKSIECSTIILVTKLLPKYKNT